MFSSEVGERQAVATVADNRDPEKRGRIKVTCIELLGDESRALPGWIEPACLWGWFVVPDVGQQVTVSYTLGTSSDEIRGQSSLTSMNVRWFGATSFTDANAEDPTPVGVEFKTNYGKRRGFKTPAGHVLLFDDTSGQQRVEITWQGGTKAVSQQSQISLDSSGISIKDQHGNELVMSASGITINPAAGGVTLTGPLRYQDALGIKTNVTAAVALLNSLTPAGASLSSAVSSAVPAGEVTLLSGLNTAAQT